MNYGTTDGILKPLSEVILPDPRFQGLVFESDSRPFELVDMHHRLSEMTLNPMLPADVRLQFDTARNLMLYAWFVYEFQTIAELQGYAALELALRLRFPEAKREVHRKGGIQVVPLGLRALLKMAVKEGLIVAEQLPAWERIQVRHKWHQDRSGVCFGRPPSVSEWQDAIMDTIPNLRNGLAHGYPRLSLFDSINSLELCADLINALFASLTSSRVRD